MMEVAVNYETRHLWGPVSHGLNILDPRHDQVDLLDVSAALQGLKRFCGRGPTTVAQHSLALAERCDTDEQRLYALLHDLPEAYIGDIPRTFRGQVPGLERIHGNILVAAYVHLGVPVPGFKDRMAVEDIDDDLNLIEAADLRTTTTGALLDGQLWLHGVIALTTEAKSSWK